MTTHDPEWEKLLSQVREATEAYEKCLAEGREWVPPTAKKPATEKDPTPSKFNPKELSSMTKEQLEQLGREHGIELDRRRRKQDLIDQLMSKK